MVLVYVDAITTRMQYAFQFVLKEIAGMEWAFSTDQLFFHQYEGPKFNYSAKAISNELHLKPATLLFENGIDSNRFTKSVKHLNEWFPGNLPELENLDIFAATFYLISRYEEYFESKYDNYGRYIPQQSILVKLDLLQTPVIDQWAIHFRKLLLARFPQLSYQKRSYAVQPTIDVDRAFLFKARPFFNQLGAIGKELITLKWGQLKDRLLTVFGWTNDVYDVFIALEKLHASHQLKAIYFLHCANDEAPDKNINLTNRDFLLLIQQLSLSATVGLHSSFKSFNNPTKLKEELAFLTAKLGYAIDLNRQHFLCWNPTLYPENLLKNGFRNDYTMGYPQRNGFRAGTCTPFLHYNLQKEKIEALSWHPLAIIESAYQAYPQEQNKEQWACWHEIITAVKQVDGTLTIAYHNHSYSNYGPFKGWAATYDKLIQMATEQ